MSDSRHGEAALVAALERALGPALETERAPEGAELVKESTVRSVHRLSLGGIGTIYLKRERPRDWGERARFLLSRSRAHAEWRNLVALRRAGVAAVEPLACVERRSFGILEEAILVTRAFEGAPFRERLSGSDEAARGELLGAAALLLRRLHDLRVFHRDFHAGNLLTGGGVLALVDVQKARWLPVLPERFRARDLAVFLYDLSEETSAEERERFLDAYGAEPRLRALAARATARRRAERLASRARRCVLPSTGFRIEKRGDLRIFRRADAPLDEVLAAIEGHRRTLARGPGAPGFVKLDLPTTAITRQPSSGAVGFPLAVKEFPAGGLVAGLASLFRRHRGRAAWLAGHALLVRRIETPLPIALVEIRRLGLVRGSFFITRWLEGAEDAHIYTDRRFASGGSAAPPGRAQGPWGEGGERAPLGFDGERAVVREFARFVARLHGEGIYHGDLKLPNFLVLEDEPGAPPRFALLDLDAVHLGGRLTRRRRAKNLAQIEDYARLYLPQVKRSHRARFLGVYGADRALVGAIERHVAFRVARRARVQALKASRGEEFHHR